MNFEDHPLTWTSTGGDLIEVYSKTVSDGYGGTRTLWKWRRIHYSNGQELAVSPRWIPRRRTAIWAARRVNPPHPWIPDEEDRPPRSARQQAIHDKATAAMAASAQASS